MSCVCKRVILGLWQYGLLITALCAMSAVAQSPLDETRSPDTDGQAVTQETIARCISDQRLHTMPLDEALLALYQHSDWQPLWRSVERREVLRDEIRALNRDGLPLWEHTVLLAGEEEAESSPGCVDVVHSAHLLRALEQLARGHLPPEHQGELWQGSGAVPDVSATSPLQLAISALEQDDLRQGFERARPQLALYTSLREHWWQWQQHWQLLGQPPVIPAGPLLRPGMSDTRVPAIAVRLQTEGLLSSDQVAAVNSHYDSTLVTAVRNYQQRYQLQVDGIVGPETLGAMNVPMAQRSQQAVINLERLRWLSYRLSDHTLLVNIAGGHGRLYQDAALRWEARVQAGRASRATPDMISVINRITLNPGWTVPPTILAEDVLPQVRESTDYLQQHNMVVLDSAGRVLDPETVDWHSPAGITLRQRPGPDNPLGRMVFRLPNPFAVYLHDTPSLHLFEAPARHFSSGCVRVDDAASLMWLLLRSLSEDQLEVVQEQLASGQTHEIIVPGGPQLVLAYWTAEADAQSLRFMPDPYARDAALIARYFSAQ